MLWLLAGAGAVSAILSATKISYVVDPVRRTVCRHFKFLWIQRVTQVADSTSVVAATTQATWMTDESNQAHGFSHRTVLIDRRGRILPLGVSRPDSLWQSNNEAEEVAKQLGCRFFRMPPESRLIVKKTGDRIDVSFGYASWWSKRFLS